MSNNEELKPCPFCGSKAVVIRDTGDFLIVGCSRVSMLCPNPSMTVYKDKGGNYDFKYWNRRA